MHKKYHEKFKILDILAVTIQAREGIETPCKGRTAPNATVTIQAREGIETRWRCPSAPYTLVTIQAREGIETVRC